MIKNTQSIREDAPIKRNPPVGDDCLSYRACPSRSHSVDVTWEHGAFLHICYSDAEEAGGDTLQADGETAVRGHAVFPAPLCSPSLRLSPPLCLRRDPPRAKRAHRLSPTMRHVFHPHQSLPTPPIHPICLVSQSKVLISLAVYIYISGFLNKVFSSLTCLYCTCIILLYLVFFTLPLSLFPIYLFVESE